MDNPIYRPEWGKVLECYQLIIVPAGWPLAAVALILMVAGMNRIIGSASTLDNKSTVPMCELALAVGFIAVPVLAVALAMSVTKVFMLRYGLTCVLGIGILFGMAVEAWTRSSRTAAVAVPVVLIAAFATQSGIWLLEQRNPAATLVADLNNGRRLAELSPEIPLVISNGLLFLEYDYYESPEVIARMYYLTDPVSALKYTGTDCFDRSFYIVQKWFPIRAHLQDYRAFLRKHPHFYVLGSSFPMEWLVRRLGDDGIPMIQRGLVGTAHGTATLLEISQPARNAGNQHDPGLLETNQ